MFRYLALSGHATHSQKPSAQSSLRQQVRLVPPAHDFNQSLCCPAVLCGVVLLVTVSDCACLCRVPRASDTVMGTQELVT